MNTKINYIVLYRDGHTESRQAESPVEIYMGDDQHHIRRVMENIANVDGLIRAGVNITSHIVNYIIAYNKSGRGMGTLERAASEINGIAHRIYELNATATADVIISMVHELSDHAQDLIATAWAGLAIPADDVVTAYANAGKSVNQYIWGQRTYNDNVVSMDAVAADHDGKIDWLTGGYLAPWDRLPERAGNTGTHLIRAVSAVSRKYTPVRRRAMLMLANGYTYREISVACGRKSSSFVPKINAAIRRDVLQWAAANDSHLLAALDPHGYASRRRLSDPPAAPVAAPIGFNVIANNRPRTIGDVVAEKRKLFRIKFI